MNEPSNSGSNQRLTTDEHIEVVGQMAGMMSANVPLVAGLKTLSEEVPSRRLKQTFERLSQKLDEGQSLEDVMKSESNDLPEWLSAVLTAGMKSGHLSDCIQHYIMFSRMRANIRVHLLTCLLYPAILVFVGLAVCGFLCVYLIPEFREIYEGFGVELPALTESLLSFSRFCEFIADNLLISIIVAAVVLNAIRVILRASLGAAGVRRLIYSLPIFGRMIKLSALAEFSQLLSLLLEARTPMHEAFYLVADTVRDPNLAEGARQAAGHLTKGESLENLKGLVPELPFELLRTPGWRSGSEAGLAESLQISSEIFTIQSEVSGRGFAGLITPITVVMTGSLIVLTVLGLFIPLVKLLNDLS